MYDSATTLRRALAAYLQCRDFPMLGEFPGWIEPVADVVLRGANRLPSTVREKIALYGGVAGARSKRGLARLHATDLAREVVLGYPPRQYPAVLLGATNGAAIHLAAALGVPWLPQTTMVVVRNLGTDPDDPRSAAADLSGPIRAFLGDNPDTVVYHHHDPNQDRVPMSGLAYVRIKWLSLPPPYVSFLHRSLAPGGQILVLNCEWQHPTTRLADRHLFQFSGLGGASYEELYRGGERVTQFLARHGSRRHSWDPPEPDADRPEAEWALDPALLTDLSGLARSGGYRIRQLRFRAPEDLSPLVADLYRWWYARRGLRTDRLLVDSFLACDPWMTARTGSVPYWAIFGIEEAHQRLCRYLERAMPYEEIRLAMFSHFTDSIGMATGAAWQAATGYARHLGEPIGFGPDTYPRDLRMIAGFHRALARVPDKQPLPCPLTLTELDQFMRAHPDRYAVAWQDELSGHARG